MSGAGPGPEPYDLALMPYDRALLDGREGPAAACGMRIVVAMARLSGARELVDVTQAHIDACLFHGQAGLDFAAGLAGQGGRVRVPTTLNVSSLDLLHPDRYRGDAATASSARQLMDAYVAMGAQATWTCAPYQLASRPSLGEHVAWAESNAVVFANSALGARTARYGDFIDIAAALTGRAPLSGLHLTPARRGQVVFDMSAVPAPLRDEDATYALLGHVIGSRTGPLVPVVVGAPALDEDRLKALGAGAASSGSVALFHVVGSTPEAPTLDAALQGGSALRTEQVTAADLAAARADLATAHGRPFAGVNLGTPHFSVAEFGELRRVLGGRRVCEGVEVYVNTGRGVLAEVEQRGWLAPLEAAGVRMVVDTCTYITPVLRRLDGLVLTNSAKWAYYAPGNLGVDVAFATLSECVESAVAGRLVTDDALWGAPAARSATAPAVPSVSRGGGAGTTRVLHAGEGEGPVLVLDAPLSFWGGVDPHTGRIIDVHHPQHGASVTGTVLVLPGGRGSSSSSSVLAEAIREGTAPAAVLMGEADDILVLGALAAAEVYGRRLPVLEVPAHLTAGLRDGTLVRVDEDGGLHPVPATGAAGT